MSESVCWVCGSSVGASANYCSNCGTQLGKQQQGGAHSWFARPDDFLAVGVFMLVAGSVIGVFGFLAEIVPLLALGLGAILLGVMVLFLPESASLRLDRVAV
ncbi:MAG: zinc-ribbon domain-containing protein, partial [Candidatus Bathyarchaeia archaeon]